MECLKIKKEEEPSLTWTESKFGLIFSRIGEVTLYGMKTDISIGSMPIMSHSQFIPLFFGAGIRYNLF